MPNDRTALWALLKERPVYGSEETLTSIHCVCLTLSDVEAVMESVRTHNPDRPFRQVGANYTWVLGDEQEGFFDQPPTTFRAVEARTRRDLTGIIDAALKSDKTD